MKNRFLTYILALLTASCMPEENLPLRNMGEISEYFIECYCQPGKDVVLTATKVVPLDGNMRYDFPPEMDVAVLIPEKIQMHYLFVNNPKDVLCRYQSSEHLTVVEGDTMYLDVTTPDWKKITARTSVPEKVDIHTHSIKENEGVIYFFTSPDPGQNYYIYTLEIKKNGEIVEQQTAYLDYSHYHKSILVERKLTASQMQNADQVILTLKRITEANYHYQVSQNAASSAVQGSITNPVPLKGNVEGALGVFTCYTEDQRVENRQRGGE